MEYILCNIRQQQFFQKLLLSAGRAESDMTFVFDEKHLSKLFSDNRTGDGNIVIETSLTWRGKPLQNFYGIDIAAQLRRAFLTKNPFVFFSALPFRYFERLSLSDNRVSLLHAKGSYLLSYPFEIDILESALNGSRSLNDHLLRAVVIDHCALKEEWSEISHKLGNLIIDYEKNRPQIQKILDEWAISINQFAPAHNAELADLRGLVVEQTTASEMAAIRDSLQRLDNALHDLSSAAVESNRFRTLLPNCPPKGFAKILVADDESQQFLIATLRDRYGYDVIDQAFKLPEAKELLDREKPDVILSDYYFKESSRLTEVPDKKIGDRFIQYALTHPQYSNTKPKKPIVLVTSKATLRTETDIRDGAVNCSGASRATDPVFIHGLIWSEAGKRGVFVPERIFGHEWTLEDTCRDGLEQCKEALPKLIKQWREFGRTIRDTLTLCRLLLESATNDDPGIIHQVIGTLEPHEFDEDFSISTVLKIFADTDRVHRQAIAAPDSNAKHAIRNILHGKIEQFSSSLNAARFLINTLPELARDLSSLPGHEKAAHNILSLFQEHSGSAPLTPLMTLMIDAVAEALSQWPEFVSPPRLSSTPKTGKSSNNINVVVVEDNEYWKDYVISAIEKTQLLLGEDFNITYQHFDNAAEALASIPSRNKSFGIDGDEVQTKTVAIVDICLPKNRAHVERIRAAVEGRSGDLVTPSTTHGLGLIETLSSYQYNVPLIVFSTVDSIGDRQTIGALGVPDEDFLAKAIDDDHAIVRALIRKIEKKTKYVIKRFEDDNNREITFWINGVAIPFTRELQRTFSAIYHLYQTTDRTEFSSTAIAEARGDLTSKESKSVIQDQMYRIRNLILETLQSNRIYVDVRELIRTRKSHSGEYIYQLNAEVMPLREEDDYETDLQRFSSEVCRVLVIENDSETLAEIIEPLESLGYEVKYATNVEDAIKEALEFLPHVISLDLQIPRTRVEADSDSAIGDEFAGLEAWTKIRTALSTNTLGIVVPTVNADKDHLVAKAVQVEIPTRNFISKLVPDWHSLLLKKVADEKRRVFLGEVADASRDICEPIIEILDDTQLAEGVLYLMVNNKPFTMKKSPLARIIGLLLLKPKTLCSFEMIKLALGSSESVTKDDTKNWTKRIRAVIQRKWLGPLQLDQKDLSKQILESSLLGLRLNVQVIDSRRK